MVFLILLVAITSVDAKTYYTSSGHPAVRYNSWDIPSSIRSYISVVEYDLAYEKGTGYGVRLYLSSLGMQKGSDWNWAQYFAWYIRANTEWADGGRSENSVTKEIQRHCQYGIIVQAIEYYYDDLSSLDKIRYGR